MPKLELNGNFSFLQVLQIFGALTAALVTTWLIVTGITGVAVRESVRRELIRPNGIIVKGIDEAILTHERITYEHNHDQFNDIQKQLSRISTQLGVCETNIKNIERSLQ